jgi:hypothetical protein
VTAATDAGPDPAEDIRLAFPAWRTNLRIARLTVSSVAADAGFGLEDIEDLRVAVTELCGALLGPTDAEEGHDTIGRIELRFRIDAGDVVLDGHRDHAPGPAPVLDPIARELLAVITDHHALEAVEGHWSFSLRKGPTPGSGEGAPGAV